MNGIAVIPRRRDPWSNIVPQLLGNLVLNRISHNQRMDVIDREEKLAQGREIRQYQAAGYREALPPHKPDIEIGNVGLVAPQQSMVMREVEGGYSVPVMQQLRHGETTPVTTGMGTPIKPQRTSYKTDTKYFMKGGQLWAQDYMVDTLQGTREPVDPPYQTKRPGTQVSVNTGDRAGVKLAEKMSLNLAEERKDVQAAAISLQNLRHGYRLLNSGVITGFGSSWMVGTGKLLQRFGFNFAEEPIANTEAYVAHMGRQVGQIIKMFGSGTGLSDADRQYAMKIAGGDIAATEKSLRKILELGETAYRNVIRDYNKRAGQAQGKFEDILPYDLLVEEPAAFAHKNKKVKQQYYEKGSNRLVLEYEDGTLVYADE